MRTTAPLPYRWTPKAWPCLLVLLLLFPLAAPFAAAEDGDGEAKAPERPSTPTTQTTLGLEGSAAFKDLGRLGQFLFRYDAEADNRGEDVNEIGAANLLLAHPGGWLIPLDPDTVDGTFFRGPLELPAGKVSDIAGQEYAATTPASHTVLALVAKDGHAELVTPIVRLGFERPRAYTAPWPFGIGFVGPLEVVKFSDGSSSALVIGQHQVLDGNTPTDVETVISIGSDKGSSDPVRWKGLDAKGDRTALWPFVRRVDVFEKFSKGRIHITASATLAGKKHDYAGTWDIVRVEPEPVRSPLLGTWQSSNGPGQAGMHHNYARPQHRYAYDFVVLEKGRTHRGDPHKNESYFAWNRSVRAAGDGVIVAFCDAERDNPGYRGAATNCYTNHIVIRHPNGLYTAYLHLRQRSIARGLQLNTEVKAGQVIARVGNSGESSEPHLHFMGFRIDTTGRWRSTPVTFTNGFHDAQGKRPLEGVALGGRIAHFRNQR